MSTGREYIEPLWEELSKETSFAGRPLYFLNETDSTNRVALEMAARGDGPLLVLAEGQSRGQGRLGRSWFSPPGVGIYLSLLYRPHLAPEDLAKATLAAGLAVGRALKEVAGVEVKLKWPNDLLLSGKKTGGILCESRLGRGGELPAVVVGVGLNINNTAEQIPPELAQRATSLRLESGRGWDRGLLPGTIITQLDAQITRLERGEFSAVLAEWHRYDALINQELAWLTPTGEVICGIALGPGPDGILQVRDHRGEVHQVLSGDLSLPTP